MNRSARPVIVTAHGSDERTARALRDGAAGVIGKPFNPEDMAAPVREERFDGWLATSGASGADTSTGMIRTMSRPAVPGP